MQTSVQHTYGCFGELFTGFLLPPFPGLENPSHLGELAFAFGRRRAAAGVLVLPPRGALLQVGFIVCVKQKGSNQENDGEQQAPRWNTGKSAQTLGHMMIQNSKISLLRRAEDTSGWA